MPPKQKFEKEDVIAAALELARKNGINAVTARALGAKLGSSSRPVFTVFKNMDDVLYETKKAAREVYNSYVEKGLREELAFKGVGTQYIRFAKEEPHLFELLFMAGKNANIDIENILPAIDANSERILQSVQEGYSLPRDAADELYRIMWVFSHGIACLCATGFSTLTDEKISRLLTEVLKGQLIRIKSEGKA